MLKDKKNDLLYLLSMIESIEKVILYSKDIETAECFFEYNEQINFNATLTLLMHIGETVGKLSDDCNASDELGLGSSTNNGIMRH